jgi:hypothetical protein
MLPEGTSHVGFVNQGTDQMAMSSSPVAQIMRGTPVHISFPSQQGKNKGTAPKLSADDAVKIRERLAAGEFMHAIAADYGVNPGRISEIKSGKRFPIEG